MSKKVLSIFFFFALISIARTFQSNVNAAEIVTVNPNIINCSNHSVTFTASNLVAGTLYRLDLVKGANSTPIASFVPTAGQTQVTVQRSYKISADDNSCGSGPTISPGIYDVVLSWNDESYQTNLTVQTPDGPLFGVSPLTVTCQSYNVTFTLSNLAPSETYRVDVIDTNGNVTAVGSVNGQTSQTFQRSYKIVSGSNSCGGTTSIAPGNYQAALYTGGTYINSINFIVQPPSAQPVCDDFDDKVLFSLSAFACNQSQLKASINLKNCTSTILNPGIAQGELVFTGTNGSVGTPEFSNNVTVHPGTSNSVQVSIPAPADANNGDLFEVGISNIFSPDYSQLVPPSILTCSYSETGPPGDDTCLSEGATCDVANDQCCTAQGLVCVASTCINLVGPPPPPEVIPPPPIPVYDGPIIDFEGLLAAAFSFLLPIAIGLIAIPLALANGYKIMTSQGDPNKKKDGIEGLVSVILGTTFVLLAYSLIRLAIRTLFGVVI